MKKTLLFYTLLFLAIPSFCQQSDWTGQYLFNPYLLNPAYGNHPAGNNITLGTSAGKDPLKVAPKHISIQVPIAPPPMGHYCGRVNSKSYFFLGGKFQQSNSENIQIENYHASIGYDLPFRKLVPKIRPILNLIYRVRLASSLSFGLGKRTHQLLSSGSLYPSGEAGIHFYNDSSPKTWSIGFSANNLVFNKAYDAELKDSISYPFKPFYSVHGEYAFQIGNRWKLKPQAFYFFNSGTDIGMFAIESAHKISESLGASIGSAYSTNNAWTFFGRMKIPMQKVAVFDLFYAYQTNTAFSTPHQIGIGLGQIAKRSQTIL